MVKKLLLLLLLPHFLFSMEDRMLAAIDSGHPQDLLDLSEQLKKEKASLESLLADTYSRRFKHEEIGYVRKRLNLVNVQKVLRETYSSDRKLYVLLLDVNKEVPVEQYLHVCIRDDVEAAYLAHLRYRQHPAPCAQMAWLFAARAFWELIIGEDPTLVIPQDFRRALEYADMAYAADGKMDKDHMQKLAEAVECAVKGLTKNNANGAWLVNFLERPELSPLLQDKIKKVISTAPKEDSGSCVAS